MIRRNILFIIAIVFLLINSTMLVGASSFSKYEIDKLSEVICEDCKYSTFLLICENFDPFGGILKNEEDCIDLPLPEAPSRRIVLKDLLKRGELQKYYKGEMIGLNESVDDWNRVDYWIKIDNITEEEIVNYLNLNNMGYIGSPYIGSKEIICFTDREGKQYKYYYSDQYGQKYWGGALIKEPRSILNLTLEISIIGGFGIISIISITFFSSLIKKKKIVLFNKYVFSYEKKDIPIKEDREKR